MVMDRLRRRLDDGGVLLLDGPTGTELERRGAAMDSAAWCGPASVANYDLLRQIHVDYLAAGCDVVTANTYAASRLMLEGAGLGDRVGEVTTAAVRAARDARDEAAGARPVAVAGSLSHMIPIQAGSGRPVADRAPGFDQVKAALRELAQHLVENGCDLILLEMMYHPERAAAAIEAARETGLPLWIGFSVRADADGRVVSYDPHAEVPFARLLELIPRDGVAAVGVMHSRADLIPAALEQVRAHYAGPLMAYPDSGHFEMPHWNFRDVMSVADFRTYARDWVDSGVQIVGGCCGLSLDHIRAIADLRR